ncbi:MAG: DNA cytosine methyltransferase [Candidatus Heimdallarchaeota archaeon]|nr:DNA cytosine methyltransferase [Candidatus Heimdallarchaeota archaeon]
MNKDISEESRSFIAVDLFCGIGGLTYGLRSSGINVVVGIDSDPSCKFTYEVNNEAKFIEKDICDVKAEEINELYPEGSIRILVGCAPCQTFSQHTQKNKNRENDDRWGLLYHFLRLVRECQPEIVSMENVPQLRKFKVFEDFVDGLRNEGYFVDYRLVNCLKYGIPQKRKRLVLLASKFGEISLISETHTNNDFVTVEKAIGHLPKIKGGDSCKNDPLHRSRKLSPINEKRIEQSKPGGSWLDWDDSLKLKCHKKESGLTYKSVYGRMRWDQHAPTITTQFYNYGTGRFGHPVQNRALSLREGALLQTFPEKYQFFQKEEDITFLGIGRHIGNAVPVKLGEIIGKSIKNHLERMNHVN